MHAIAGGSASSTPSLSAPTTEPERVPLIVRTTSDSGAGSLRDAIERANLSPGLDTITFDFAPESPGCAPLPGTCTIRPSSPLPSVSDPVLIDGFGPTDAALSSGPTPFFPEQMRVELDGSVAGADANGLLIQTGGSTIRGLAINRFSGAGLVLEGSGNTVITTYVGTDVIGSAPLGNVGPGIEIRSGNNRVGDGEGRGCNLVSGNQQAGIQISGRSAVDNRIECSYVGTDRSGTLGIGNQDGIRIDDAERNVIGGASLARRNVIAGNRANGIVLADGGTPGLSGNAVQGNFIGTDPTGRMPLGNMGNGVRLAGANNIIGGDTAVAGNVISGNAGNGVEVLGSSSDATRLQNNIIGGDASGVRSLGNGQNGITVVSAEAGSGPARVRFDSNTIAFNVGAGLSQQGGPVIASMASNAIFSNGKLGIDLGDDGPTINDIGDTDLGPNRLQNFPLLQSVDTGPGVILVQGMLQSIARSTYSVELFASPTCDPSGFGQGRRPLGTTAVTTDTSGEMAFEARLRVTVAPGELLTATATDADGNTSEFSPCRPAAASLLLAAGPTASPTSLAIVPAPSPGARTPSPFPSVRPLR